MVVEIFFLRNRIAEIWLDVPDTRQIVGAVQTHTEEQVKIEGMSAGADVRARQKLAKVNEAARPVKSAVLNKAAEGSMESVADRNGGGYV